jgi:hypothetical protein
MAMRNPARELWESSHGDVVIGGFWKSSASPLLPGGVADNARDGGLLVVERMESLQALLPAESAFQSV